MAVSGTAGIVTPIHDALRSNRKPLYTPLDRAQDDFPREVGFPAAYPYTRGIYAEHVPRQAVDHAPVRRVWHRERDQPDDFTIC